MIQRLTRWCLTLMYLQNRHILNFNDRSIVLAHGHKLDEKNIPALKEGDILLCGHTHVPKCEKRDNYIYMNPGSVSIPKENSEHSYMILDDKFYWKNLDGEEIHGILICRKQQDNCM